MRLNNGLDDWEPEASARFLCGNCLPTTKVPIEDPRYVLCWDAGACVLDRNDDVVRVAAEFDVDLASGG
jgi:hypothetical protein